MDLKEHQEVMDNQVPLGHKAPVERLDQLEQQDNQETEANQVQNSFLCKIRMQHNIHLNSRSLFRI